MRLHLRDGSRLLIDLRATGLLRAVAHSPTLAVAPDRVTVDLADAPGETPVEATFRAEAIEAPSDIPPSDRIKMVENLRGPEVLDARRFPTIDFRGRYQGTPEAGTLSGELHLRGAPRRLSMSIRASREGDALVATGAWEGRLTDLGIKPFKALLGAIKLEDHVKLRLEVRFDAPGDH
jgi:polyisoprenoid-binding protein YceI